MPRPAFDNALQPAAKEQLGLIMTQTGLVLNRKSLMKCPHHQITTRLWFASSNHLSWLRKT